MSNKTHAKAHQLRQHKREEFSKPFDGLVIWVHFATVDRDGVGCDREAAGKPHAPIFQ